MYQTSIDLSLYPPIFLYIYLYIHPSIYLFIHQPPYIHQSTHTL